MTHCDGSVRIMIWTIRLYVCMRLRLRLRLPLRLRLRLPLRLRLRRVSRRSRLRGCLPRRDHWCVDRPSLDIEHQPKSPTGTVNQVQMSWCAKSGRVSRPRARKCVRSMDVESIKLLALAPLQSPQHAVQQMTQFISVLSACRIRVKLHKPTAARVVRLIFQIRAILVRRGPRRRFSPFLSLSLVLPLPLSTSLSLSLSRREWRETLSNTGRVTGLVL